jgi:hypothetical protein
MNIFNYVRKIIHKRLYTSTNVMRSKTIARIFCQKASLWHCFNYTIECISCFILILQRVAGGQLHARRFRFPYMLILVLPILTAPKNGMKRLLINLTVVHTFKQGIQ